jgi:hypothetical protein
MPDALALFMQDDPDRKKRFFIIDDSITSGMIPPIVRGDFSVRYPLDSVKIACGADLLKWPADVPQTALWEAPITLRCIVEYSERGNPAISPASRIASPPAPHVSWN